MMKYLLFVCFSLLLISSAHSQEAIHNAAKAGDLGLVKNLVAANPSLLEAKDKNGLTPLHYASTTSLETVSYLIEKGADVNVQSNNGTTPLYSATRFGQIEIARYLLEHKANVNAKSEGGSPMHQAVYRSPKELVELLLNYKADLSITDKQGQTAIHVASTWNADTVLKMLIAAGGDVNAKDNMGNTPLHVCQEFLSEKSTNVPKVAVVLIENKAFLNERNNAGLTPLGLAKQKKAALMIDLLKESGATE